MSDMPRETLRKLAAAGNYNLWIFNLCRPFLGRRILEVGCGTGNMTEFFLAGEPYLATDREPQRLQELRQRWPERRGLQAKCWDISAPAPPAAARFHPDTILCINILEHVQQDRQALRNLHDLLTPGGRLLLYVPALPILYGSLDRELSHCRRYGRSALRTLVQEAGFQTETLHFVNGPGILGWWLNSRLLRRRYFSLRQIRWYDRMIPLIAWWEKRVPPPLGQSLFCVGRKT